MKKYLIYTYLLFVLLITGAFASMAQNEYGKTLLGLVASFFSLLFVLQLKDTLHYQPNNRTAIIELICLMVISAVSAFEIFNLANKPLEWLFILAVIVLIFVYISRMVHLRSSMQSAAGGISRMTFVFYTSLIIYLISLILIRIKPVFAGPAWLFGFILLALFAAGAWLSKPALLEGEKVSVFQFVFNFKDRSLLLISLFLIFTLYAGFTRFGWLPKMYTSDLPQSYYKLLNEAETGQEVPVQGSYRHEAFKMRYDQLVKNQLDNKD